MKTYNHINDCWNALREAKNVDEVKELFNEFPRKFGAWNWRWGWESADSGYLIVENTYFDRKIDICVTDAKALDIFIRPDGENKDEIKTKKVFYIKSIKRNYYISCYKVEAETLEEAKEKVLDFIASEEMSYFKKVYQRNTIIDIHKDKLRKVTERCFKESPFAYEIK